VRPDKRVSIRLSSPVERALLDKLGAVVTADAAHAVLSVPAIKVNAIVRDALAALPVVDLTIEDPPLEEVMRELFSGQRERERAAGAGDDGHEPKAAEGA
jgi:ABC-2 type transport system ATP-binding protein